MKNWTGKPYYLAGNAYEGCGHRHRSAKACMPCVERLNMHYTDTASGRNWPKAKIYRIVPGDRMATREIKSAKI